MEVNMFGKKKKLVEQPLGYWEKWSCFQVVPDEPSRKWTSDDFIAAVGKVNGAKVNFTKYSDKEEHMTAPITRRFSLSAALNCPRRIFTQCGRSPAMKPKN